MEHQNLNEKEKSAGTIDIESSTSCKEPEIGASSQLDSSTIKSGTSKHVESAPQATCSASNNGTGSGRDTSTQRNISSQRTEEDDKELHDLLDSTLPDFAKPVKTPVEPKKPEGPAAAQAMPAEWDNLFDNMMQNNPEESLKQMMDMMKNEDPEMANQFQKLVEASGDADSSEEATKTFQDTLKNTLDCLAKSAEDCSQDDVPPDDLMKALEEMNLNEGMDPANFMDQGFMPTMQNMMKSLLSKDVLYPPLKELATKFPDWFAEHGDKVSAEDLARYRKQHELMKRLCGEFESHSDATAAAASTENSAEPTSAAVGNPPFETVMNIMQEMQELGQPPPELVGNAEPGAEGFPPSLFPNADMLQENGQCSIM